jgi:threonine dehydrogenase-like Zn-dependent dehydrogenase
MRAVVALGGRLTCEEIPELEPAPGQVLVKTLCCGICGSDLHALHHLDRMVEFSRRGGDGGFSAIDPSRGVVFGYEVCAEILDYGPGSVRPICIGARVVSIPVIAAATGMETVGYSNKYPGGYAERMLVTEDLLLSVPNELSNQQAAMTEPFAVGAHAVARAAIDQPSAAVVSAVGRSG